MTVLQFGGFELRQKERVLLRDGCYVKLGARAFDTLQALIDRRERIVTKDELMHLVWPGLVVEDNNLQVQVNTLRKIFGAEAISTVPRRGYRWMIAVGAAPPPVPPTTVDLDITSVASGSSREEALAAVVRALAELDAPPVDRSAGGIAPAADDAGGASFVVFAIRRRAAGSR
jgi:DNA-binding winged helix-turn-helix (wHTH) protein